MPEVLEIKDIKVAITEGVAPVAAEVKAVKDSFAEQKTLLEKQSGEIKKLTDDAVENQKALDLLIKERDEAVAAVETKGDQPSLVMKGLSAKADELKAIHAMKSGSIQIEMKAVGPISLAESFGTDVLRGYREPGISSKPYNPRFVLGLISTMFGGPGSNPLSWVNRVPKEGGPAWTAEMAQKPGMDWTYTADHANMETLAVYTVVTRQALLSMPILEQEINSLLNNELLDKLERDILSGSGVSPIIKGIMPYATAFNAGSLAGTIPGANVFDVIRVAIGQVRKANFFPNGVIVSIDRATSMDLTKDNEGRYLLPPFTSADGTVIKGIRVYESNFIGDDEFLVGDFTKYLFNFVEGVTVAVGYIDKQFIENMVTIRAELSGMGRVKLNETPAFVKGTFSTAIAALSATT